MRILHTADWHLGQRLHGQSRVFEHASFLGWLLERLEDEQVDALFVAGDVFDAASPSAEAQAQYFGFLADARRRNPRLDIVVVGGNHDAPARLDAARAVLDALRVHVVGGLPRRDEGWDLDRLFVPLTNASGTLEAILISVPYLRPKDLPRSLEEARTYARVEPHPEPVAPPARDLDVRIAEGYAWTYRALCEAAERLRPEGGALLATGHAYVAGGRLSEGSERQIQQGNQQALPPSVFPETLSYVALGHLHLAQQVGHEPHVRYSGSPIPLSLAELNYPHQVVLVDIEGPGRPRAVRPLPVPRAVEILRIPETHAPLDDVLPRLLELPRTGPPGSSEAERPMLEVRVRIDGSRPRLRRELEGALEGAWPRLVRIDVARPPGGSEATVSHRELSQLSPQDVFRALHERQRGGTPPAALATAFFELIESVEEAGGCRCSAFAVETSQAFRKSNSRSIAEP